MKIEDFLCLFKEMLQKNATKEAKLEAIARVICRAFSTKNDEVAIFAYNPELESLSFLYPPNLVNSGSVPFTASHSLVVQTVSENKGIMNNSFATTRHVSIFELFPGSGGGAKPLPIQKILSVPIGRDGVVTGAIQVSRKGEDALSAGKDFSQTELYLLEKIGETVSDHADCMIPKSC